MKTICMKCRILFFWVFFFLKTKKTIVNLLSAELTQAELTQGVVKVKQAGAICGSGFPSVY